MTAETGHVPSGSGGSWRRATSRGASAEPAQAAVPAAAAETAAMRGARQARRSGASGDAMARSPSELSRLRPPSHESGRSRMRGLRNGGKPASRADACGAMRADFVRRVVGGAGLGCCLWRAGALRPWVLDSVAVRCRALACRWDWRYNTGVVRRLLALVALLLLFCVPAAADAAQSDIARYVLPPGNFGGIPTGPHSLDQLPLYGSSTFWVGYAVAGPALSLPTMR